ncbi:TRAP transporter small permease subunit [Litoreibacter arenae]|uniref:TRAP transporter small permease protein n=1 Tax=Litoreibacter arenae DSM 19593 TaxID=1123360 RepID=S9QN28_9RHOB|nr:TRAP transporter small permease [Litoreibacter arenae]EPX81087.1 TRAP-type C4-dicarboxylate transport system, small permease component [Litoreibacter arenae DSM 19593]
MSINEHKPVTPIEWLIPLAFSFVFGWVVWHGPAYILDFGPENGQLAAQFARTDITPNIPPLFEFGDIIDYVALILSPVLFIFGVMTVRRAPMEYQSGHVIDRGSVFIGRVTMMLVVLLTSVMIYEVVLRYVFEKPTIWANELSLWLAGFVFLCAGLYAMQQRSHIRIFLLYDMMPRTVQRVCDIVSTLLIIAFAFFLFYGGYGEATAKFMRWETFGTAFDPPIPATLKPAVLLLVWLVAIQAVINLITDWNQEPVLHTAADDIDPDEIERLKKAVGSEGVGDMDVTRSAIQHGKAGQG